MIDWLGEFLPRLQQEHMQHHPNLVSAGRDAGGVFVWGTMGYESVLKADGSLWVREDAADGGPGPWRRAADQERYGIVAQAALKWPILARLVPPKPPTAHPCPHCDAGRNPLFRNLLCPKCWSLRWLVDAAKP